MSKNNDIFKYRYIFIQYIGASILYISIHFETRYRYFMLFRTSLCRVLCSRFRITKWFGCYSLWE